MHPIAVGEILTVDRLKKVYRSGGSNTELVLFENLSFTVREGELLAIVGESGSGKSTLLHLLGTLDSPTQGTVMFAGKSLSGLSESDAADFRNRHIGYLWQFHYLLPEFTALENVAMPLLARGDSPQQAYARSAHWIDRVGLTSRAHHRPGELSGGEQQRIALARALVTSPRLLLADEPTGDLDARTADAIFSLIRTLHDEALQGRSAQQSGAPLTSLIVTHNLEFARRCDRVLRLRDGHIEDLAPAALQ